MTSLVLHHEARGSGPALILLNGMSQSTANWRSQMRALAEHFTVVAYDARGQGRTPLGDAPITLELHVADLLRLLDELGHARVHLCGFSHGARIALAAAAQHPERVDRLVLTSTGMMTDPLRRVMVRGWSEVLRLGGLEAMAWTVLPDILGRRFLADNEAHLDAMVRATLQRNTAAGLAALMDAMREFPAPDADARAVTCPTLLITADEDRLVSRDAAAALADALAAEHTVIEGVGHTIPVEAPEAWRERILSFLS